jgi:hypothetical protein
MGTVCTSGAISPVYDLHVHAWSPWTLTEQTLTTMPTYNSGPMKR